jgi:oligoribonuclease NrnB/cAMP/cGMP phosphodiesterase (DHH superfamily)
LTTKDDDGSLGAEVSSRLDELFGDEDAAEVTGVSLDSSDAVSVADESKSTAKTAAKPRVEKAADDLDANSPIRNLKALVFSIDWEITDETMLDFLTETKRLQQKYKDDKILSMFLKLHESIGKYIKAKKARAHPDSIKFVASVYKSFEKVFISPGMKEKQKKQLLTAEVKKFKDFKQRVLLRDGAAKPAEVVKSPVIADARVATPVSGAGMSLETKAAVDYILEQVKKEIKAEFHTLRQIIKNIGA